MDDIIVLKGESEEKFKIKLQVMEIQKKKKKCSEIKVLKVGKMYLVRKEFYYKKICLKVFD